MSKKSVSIVLVASLLLWCSSSSIQAAEQFKAGTVDISIQYTGGPGTIAVVPFMGYFVSDNIEIGGGFTLERGKLSGDGDKEDVDNTGFEVLCRYHLVKDSSSKSQVVQVVPFFEAGFANFNLNIEDEDFDVTVLLLGGGIRVFHSSNFSTNFFIDYIIGDLSLNNENYDYDSFRLGFSLSLFVF